MNEQTDAQLLSLYAESQVESAFAELMRRHLDFVYSAAIRLVRDPHLAEDVTQSVFVALVKNAPQLLDRPVLCGWLHQTARNIAAQTVRTIERRRAREQEAVAMDQTPADPAECSWEQIAPHLETALGELSEADRDAVILRYFKNHDFICVGRLLGVSDDAAQKRVSRAVDQMRDFFAKRGIAAGAGVLVAGIFAHGVKAAPVGLAAAVSSAAATAVTTSTVVAIKTIAMTTIQKSLLAAAFAAIVGGGIFEAHQAAQFREQNRALQQAQAVQAEEIQRLQEQYRKTTNRLAGSLAENSKLKSNGNQRELLKLRGELTQLKASGFLNETDPTAAAAKLLAEKANRLKLYVEQNVDKQIPELQLLSEKDWFDAVSGNKLAGESDFRDAVNGLRCAAKNRFGDYLRGALRGYATANGGELPGKLEELKPFFDPPINDAIIQRYKLLKTGKLKDVPPDETLVAETAPPVDEKVDTSFEFRMNGTKSNGVRQP